jgi:hypothetical protein
VSAPDAEPGTAPDPERAALEGRYRRLLRCYPPGHREVHREEMLGVLLAAARPGQRAPGVRQTVNLVACGLAIRARRALAAGPWQDALAVVSLIVPVLMLIIAVLDCVLAVREAVNEAAFARVPVWQLFSFVPQIGGPAIVAAAWLAVVLLVRTGRRRSAAAIVFALLAVDLTDLLTLLMYRAGAWSGGLPLFVGTVGGGPVVLVSLAACSLAFSAGPRPGLAIAGKRRACLMIASLSVIFGYATVLFLLSPSAQLPDPVTSVLHVLAIVAAIVVTRVPGAAGGRVAALIVAGLLPGLASIVPFQSIPTADLVFLSGTLLVAVLVWLVAIASWRAHVSRESRAAAE